MTSDPWIHLALYLNGYELLGIGVIGLLSGFLAFFVLRKRRRLPWHRFLLIGLAGSVLAGLVETFLIPTSPLGEWNFYLLGATLALALTVVFKPSWNEERGAGNPGGGVLTVFISYRRKDVDGYAIGRITDRLAEHFGRDNVFLDIDAIPAGLDYAKHLRVVLTEIDVLLAVVGPEWLNLLVERQEKDGGGEDFVVEELKAALEKGIPVIPLLLGGAVIPSRDSLPVGIADLSGRQALKVDSGYHFHSDIERLIKEIRRSCSKAE